MKNEDSLSHYSDELARSHKNSIDEIYRKKRSIFYITIYCQVYVSSIVKHLTFRTFECVAQIY
ncbi:MAG: hypothetical protein EMLJLAPB_00285 [Candidatus Argoarchaeum ethanivorans]|uniref:Uncharacterized protein n=1 Tax=Candidatus Argoarchaeum ethanivorans TaxID=2608793 RepID=A0A811T8G8_9EURY|nr:MAG: hypothetical protein FFODKBPE_00035 [Candidatus Argoarchaeum ethanivorans]CAD6492454.1 MAG: hypothetical protein EMLJLAPB_00285 [Candidatus Argoarchaeum ethanivorans]